MSELQSPCNLVCRLLLRRPPRAPLLPYTTLFRSRHREGAVMAETETADTAEWQARAKGLLKAELKRRNVTYAQLAERLGTIGVRETEHNIRNKIARDRKSTCLNSSHLVISYAVFCFGDHRERHSFPTRRSSDLAIVRVRSWQRRKRRTPPSGRRGRKGC